MTRTAGINNYYTGIQLKLIICAIACCLLGGMGANAQEKDSAFQSKALKFTQRQLYVPVGLIVSGVLLNDKSPGAIDNKIVDFRKNHLGHFHTHLDNYLQYTPVVLTYSFEAMGMKPKTDLINRSVILLKSELMMLTIVEIVKKNTHKWRPDGSDHYSFPSGHTAQAFAEATLLSEEYGYRYKWVPYLSYGLATTVGVIRMANNKHYLSDVILAAGIGILSTKISYWTHQYKWNKGKSLHPAF